MPNASEPVQRQGRTPYGVTFPRLFTPKHAERYNHTKDDEIAEADAADEEIMQEIRGMNHLSNTEKRALLSER